MKKMKEKVWNSLRVIFGTTIQVAYRRGCMINRILIAIMIYASLNLLKGSSDAKFKLFEQKCVLEVCVHIHPIMIKVHPVFFFKSLFLKSPFSNQAVLRLLSEWRSSVQAPPTIVDWQDRLTLDPPWVSWELPAIVSTLVQGKTRCLRLSDWSV